MASALDLLKKVGYTIVNWNNIIGKPSTFPPSPHKSSHASGGADAITPADIGAVANAGSTPSIQAGADSSKPAAGTAGRIYIATDTFKIYRDNGTSWDVVGTINWNDITGKPSSFTPSAHKSTHATGGTDPLTPADIGAVNKAGDTIKPSTDSTTAFQVQKSDGSIVLDVDTANKRVGVLTATPDQPLTVNGNIKTTGQFISTVATGTAPLSVSSTTVVTNLNADMVDGVHVTSSSATGLRRITTSTSAPSGGSDGDIWIQYT